VTPMGGGVMSPDDDGESQRRWREFQQNAGGGPDLPMEIDGAGPGVSAVVLADYNVVKAGRYWVLTYPDGGWQRTKTRRDAHRLAALHFCDRSAWTIEVQGDGAGPT
jgi:hypothetical protein